MSLLLPCEIPNSYLSPVDAGLIAHPEKFVPIESLQAFRAQMREDSGIHFFNQGDFVICRYTVSIPEVFQTAWDLESRGLVFDAQTGELLSRPLHKFFNMGERAGLNEIDFSGGWDAFEKLDGSMIGAFVHQGEVHFHTRGGISPQARAALEAASENELALVLAASAINATPVFEWTAPENRIVIPYDRSELTLLALRDNATGAYLDREEIAREHGVKTAATIATGINSAQDFLDLFADLVERKDIEGIVLVGPNGRRVKVKCREYLKRHKILANLGNERYAYEAWIDDVIDDTASALGGTRAATLKAFEAQIEARIVELQSEVTEILRTIDASDRRAAAKEVMTRFQGVYQSLVFGALDGDTVRDRLRQILIKRVATPDKRAAFKTDVGFPDWIPIRPGGD